MRERLLASNAVTVFAPCLHRAACPMLARDEEVGQIVAAQVLHTEGIDLVAEPA